MSETTCFALTYSSLFFLMGVVFVFIHPESVKDALFGPRFVLKVKDLFFPGSPRIW